MKERYTRKISLTESMQFDEDVENVLPKFVILSLEKPRKKRDFKVFLSKK